MTLADLARATHIEITLPLGGRLVVTREVYTAMDEALLVGTVPRALSRKQVIARRARARWS